MVVALGAAILGDQLGYVLGRIGGRRALDAITRRIGGAEVVHRAEAFALRWGALGIFLSRWLVGGLGPSINISSGIARYSWPRFLFWDVLGEAVWVGVYVTLGRVFDDRIHDLADLVSSIGWLAAALIVATASGWALAHEVRRARHRALEVG